MGKNYSRNNATGKRKVSDFYETPYCLIKEFIETDKKNWDFSKSFLDGSSGRGALEKVLKDYFHNIEAYDITDGKDFLKEERKFAYSIQNPPYGISLPFILKAKEIITDRFAFLLPLTYLQGKERLETVWKDKEYPLASVYVFNRYPMLGEELRDDWKIHTGMQTYCWMVWDKHYTGEPVIRWLDIDGYIIRRKDEIKAEVASVQDVEKETV